MTDRDWSTSSCRPGAGLGDRIRMTSLSSLTRSASCSYDRSTITITLRKDSKPRRIAPKALHAGAGRTRIHAHAAVAVLDR